MELFSRCLRLNYHFSTNCNHLKIVDDVCKCIQRLPAKFKLKYSEENVQQFEILKLLHAVWELTDWALLS